MVTSLLAHASASIMPHQGVSHIKPLNRQNIFDILAKKNGKKSAGDGKKKKGKDGGTGGAKAGKNKKKTGRVN